MNQQWSINLIDVIQIIGGLISPFLLAYIAYIQTRRNQLEMQLNDKKRATYEEFIDLLVDAMKNPNHNNIEKRMFDLKKDFILFASPESIKAFNEWTKNSSNNKNEFIFRDVENLIRCLRKEIGLSNHGLSKYQVLQILIKDDLSKYDKKK